jgi:hypothetical protein
MLELSKKVEETNLIKKEQEQGININNSILLKEEVYTD